MMIKYIIFNKFKKIYIFTVLLFIILFFVNIFLSQNENLEHYDIKDTNISNNSLESNFDDIEAPLSTKEKYDLIIKGYKEDIKKQEIKITSKENIIFSFKPYTTEKILLKSDKLSDISDLLFTKLFKKYDLTFNIEFINDSTSLRARYIHNTIKIYNAISLSREESLAIFIHELGHYFDVKYLEKQVFYDVSNKFYSISWEDTKVLKNGNDKNDFVSGYAMSNKYEDFAESFTFYILFNDDFREKSAKSNILEEKYKFFSNYIFKNDEFKKTNFRNTQNLPINIWDSTKINFSIKNFLEYLKNGI